MSHEILVAGNTPTFRCIVRDSLDDSIIDISSGFTIKYRYRINGGTLIQKTATVSDGPAGKAIYKFPANDFLAGQLQYEWDVTDAGLNNFTQNRRVFEKEIRPKL